MEGHDAMNKQLQLVSAASYTTKILTREVRYFRSQDSKVFLAEVAEFGPGEDAEVERLYYRYFYSENGRIFLQLQDHGAGGGNNQLRLDLYYTFGEDKRTLKLHLFNDGEVRVLSQYDGNMVHHLEEISVDKLKDQPVFMPIDDYYMPFLLAKVPGSRYVYIEKPRYAGHEYSRAFISTLEHKESKVRKMELVSINKVSFKSVVVCIRGLGSMYIPDRCVGNKEQESSMLLEGGLSADHHLIQSKGQEITAYHLETYRDICREFQIRIQ